MSLTLKQIKTATADELHEFLGNSMCAEPDCRNTRASGYRYCEACVWGSPSRGSDEQIAAKRRLARLIKQENDEDEIS